MIIHTDVEASLRLRCADLLLTALDNCRDVVQVTDSQDRVIYENNSTEKILGYSSSDWLVLYKDQRWHHRCIFF